MTKKQPPPSVAFRFPPELVHSLRLRAKGESTSMTKLVERYCSEGLARTSNSKKLDEVLSYLRPSW